MKITSYYYSDKNLVISIDAEDGNEHPALAIRAAGENERYHIALILGEKSSEGYSFNLSDISNHILNNSYSFADFVSVNKKTAKLSGVMCAEYCIGPLVFNNDNSDGCSIFFEKTVDSLGRLSIRIEKKGNNSISASFSEDLEKISITNPFKTGSFYFARRASNRHDYSYDAFVEIGTSVSDFPTNKMLLKLDNRIKTGKEIWDFVFKIGVNIFPVTMSKNIAFSYTKINDAFNAKFFISENKYLCVFTDEGINENQNKIKVAVMGSCYTKQAFHAIDFTNRDYKRFYENQCIIFHTTFASLMSKPFFIDNKHFEEPGVIQEKLLKMYGKSEFEKDGIERIRNYKPQYLLIDLFTESRNVIFKINDDTYITDTFFFEKTYCYNILSKYERLKIEDIRREELFINAVKKFREKISEYLPLDHIVLVKSEAAFSYIDKQNNVKYFENQKWIKNANKIWEKYNNYFLQIIPECRVLDMTKGKYLGYEDSPFVLSSNHLESRYYKDLLDKLNKIVLQDMIKNGEF